LLNFVEKIFFPADFSGRFFRRIFPADFSGGKYFFLPKLLNVDY